MLSECELDEEEMAGWRGNGRDVLEIERKNGVAQAE